MQQIPGMWTTLIVGAFLTGACMVAVLVTRRSAERLFGVAGIAAFFSAAWAFGLLSEAYARLDAVLYAVAFAIAAATGGYALASTLLGMLSRPTRTPAELSALPADTREAALVILGDDEPTQYDERATATALDHLADEGLLHASIAILPFLFMAQKARYRAVGGSSGSERQLDALAENVEALLASTPFGAVGTASLRGTGDLETAVRKAASSGYRRIVVAEAMVGESLELDQGKRRVDALRLEEKGVHVAYTEVLADSERVAALVASGRSPVSGYASTAENPRRASSSQTSTTSRSACPPPRASGVVATQVITAGSGAAGSRA